MVKISRDDWITIRFSKHNLKQLISMTFTSSFFIFQIYYLWIYSNMFFNKFNEKLKYQRFAFYDIMLTFMYNKLYLHLKFYVFIKVEFIYNSYIYLKEITQPHLMIALSFFPFDVNFPKELFSKLIWIFDRPLDWTF